MPTLTITEFSGQGNTERGFLAPAAPLLSIASQAVNIAAGSTPSLALNASTALVRIATDTACRWVAGVNPTALAASSLPYAAGQSEYFTVVPGSNLKVAVIAAA